MKINRKAVAWIVVAVVVIGVIALAAANGPLLWETLLRMHGMR